jgi:hypothetical protein
MWSVLPTLASSCRFANGQEFCLVQWLVRDCCFVRLFRTTEITRARGSASNFAFLAALQMGKIFDGVDVALSCQLLRALMVRVLNIILIQGCPYYWFLGEQRPTSLPQKH